MGIQKIRTSGEGEQKGYKESGRGLLLGMTMPVLVLFCICCIIPFVLIISASLSSESYIGKFGYSVLPHIIRDGEAQIGISTEGYQFILKNGAGLFRAYGVTIAVTLIGTLFSLFLVTMAGYVLSRQDFRYRNQFSFFLFFTTLFSGGLFPTYYTITQVLNLKNNLLAIILPMSFSVWNMLLVKGYMRGIPDALAESAKIDGAGDFKIYSTIMMPLCKPVLATVGLFTALGYWNDWYSTMLYISDSDKYMLQYYLYKMINSAENMKMIAGMSGGAGLEVTPIETTKMALTLVVIGPIIFLYPFVQKYFVKGLTIGSVKG